MTRPDPSGAGYRVCEMTTGSMRPTVGRGDRLLVEPWSGGELSPGDLVLLPPQGDLEFRCIHRFVRRIEAGGRTLFVTKGDANLGVDKPREPSEILGRAVFLSKRGGPWVPLGTTPRRHAMLLTGWALCDAALRAVAFGPSLFVRAAGLLARTGRLSGRVLLRVSIAAETALEALLAARKCVNRRFALGLRPTAVSGNVLQSSSCGPDGAALP